MTLPPWPAERPTHGRISLRGVEEWDVVMARQLSTDPYVPQSGSLPDHASDDDARAWVVRQQGRHAEEADFSFTTARRSDDAASIRTAKRAGYLEEGVLASHQVIDGESRDMIVYASVQLSAGGDEPGV